jgi:hypothetical protein
MRTRGLSSTMTARTVADDCGSPEGAANSVEATRHAEATSRLRMI